MNMTPDEQRALVQFFGTVHAQAKQTDQLIVGNSQFVRPVSPSIQHGLEQALRIPVQANQQAPQQQYVEPPAHPYIETPQFIEEPSIQEQSPNAYLNIQSEETKPVVFSNDIVEVLKEINLNLTRIGNILEKRNGTPKKTKTLKSD
jgi:hypothetical protein